MWTFEQIINGALDNVEKAKYPGIYKVFAPEGFRIAFNSYTDAIKDTNNTKSVAVLEARLSMIRMATDEDDKNVLYIGKTDATLRERVLCFAKYGYGKVDNHHGGYPLWQIQDNKKLLVEIYPFMDEEKDPHKEETRLLDDYIDRYGTEPLANTAVGRGSKYKYVVSTDEYIVRNR